MLKLYRLVRRDEGFYEDPRDYNLSATWGSYFNVIVAAADDRSARQTHPELGPGWRKSDPKPDDRSDYIDSWPVSPDFVAAELIGTALPATKPGVIIASQNLD